ncbi:MAG: methyltransferase, partial [Asgard group archaeon]|nr:methyltransferase [Asgard group archaeon]
KQGHLYEPFKDLVFDSIIANPPLMAGKKILTELVIVSKEHLREKGTLQIVVPKKKGLKSMQKLLTEAYGSFEVLAKGSGFWVLKTEK